MNKLLHRNTHNKFGIVNEVHLKYIDYQIIRLHKGEEKIINSENEEFAIIVNEGDGELFFDDKVFRFENTRKDPFLEKPQLAIFPPQTKLMIRALTEMEYAYAATFQRKGCCKEVTVISSNRVEEKWRGEEGTLRRVRTLIPKDIETNLLLYEVITEAGNWSSYPPHKHDTENPPLESKLEEIYCYRIKPSNGFAFQRVFNDDLTLDENYAVYDYDIVSIPNGYHPTSAAPGFSCYTQCVMAGPTIEWNFTVHSDYLHLMNWSK